MRISDWSSDVCSSDLAGSVDGAIAGYRALTGKATLMPKWAYGFWQSRQRYETQEQLLDVMREYRKRRIPIDNIVQDWFYWPENAWGSHDFDKTRFPDAKAMVDEVHALHGHRSEEHTSELQSLMRISY